MKRTNNLHIVHCIDTEGPLTESIASTFERISQIYGLTISPTVENLIKLQTCQIDCNGAESEIARTFSPDLLKYNSSWSQIEDMLADAMSLEFRNQLVDSSGRGWTYSWHCVDHLGFTDNPRKKDIGYGHIFRRYKQYINNSDNQSDELNWHFHPLSLTRSPIAAATSYTNSMDVLTYILSRRVIDDDWFPVVNRPGFHSERIDSNLFLEQWIPFDYANQATQNQPNLQRDLTGGRFGDWSRAPQSWLPYHPSHDDYQTPGNCKRLVFRCLNVGTRHRCLTESDVHLAFQEAARHGFAILAFANHDYRDIRPDVNYVRSIISELRDHYPDVSLNFSGAEEAAREYLRFKKGSLEPKPFYQLELSNGNLIIKLVSGKLYGTTPYLSIKDKHFRYFTDNLDEISHGRIWSYHLDQQTIPHNLVDVIAVASAGADGGFSTHKLTL